MQKAYQNYIFLILWLFADNIKYRNSKSEQVFFTDSQYILNIP